MHTRRLLPVTLFMFVALVANIVHAAEVSIVEEKVVPGMLTVSVYTRALNAQNGPLPV
jgi:hypothetical protein